MNARASVVVSGVLSSMSTKIGVLCKTNDDYGTDVELLCGEWCKKFTAASQKCGNLYTRLTVTMGCRLHSRVGKRKMKRDKICWSFFLRFRHKNCRSKGSVGSGKGGEEW